MPLSCVAHSWLDTIAFSLPYIGVLDCITKPIEYSVLLGVNVGEFAYNLCMASVIACINVHAQMTFHVMLERKHVGLGTIKDKIYF